MSTRGSPSEEAKKRRQAAARTGWLAIVHALLILAAYVLLNPAPNPSSDNTAFMEYYGSSSSHTAIVVAGFYLLPFAGIAFMWFIIALRIWIRRTSEGLRDEFYSTGQLVSGVVYLTLLLVAAASIAVLALDAGPADAGLDPQLARQFTELSWALAAVFAMRMAAVFVVTTAALGRRHGFLPKWFSLASYVIGAILLVGTSVSQLLVLVMPVWMLILGGLLLVRSRSAPEALMGTGDIAPERSR
jgi:hypothetical protein